MEEGRVSTRHAIWQHTHARALCLPLDLDDNLLPCLQHRAVDLSERRGGERRALKRLEELVDRPIELRLYDRERAVRIEAWHLILQARELLDRLRREHVDARREELADLDEGRPELYQHVAQARRQLAVRLDLRVAVSALRLVNKDFAACTPTQLQIQTERLMAQRERRSLFRGAAAGALPCTGALCACMNCSPSLGSATAAAAGYGAAVPRRCWLFAPARAVARRAAAARRGVMAVGRAAIGSPCIVSLWTGPLFNGPDRPPLLEAPAFARLRLKAQCLRSCFIRRNRSRQSAGDLRPDAADLLALLALYGAEVGAAQRDLRAEERSATTSSLFIAAALATQPCLHPDVTDNAPTPPPEEPVDTKPLIMKSTESIEKPDLDERTYRHLVLHNKLQIMLVSDLSCDHAAAALDVNIGSASDPVELPGLAHFLEHMLFLGTEKYPKEDAYQNYLEQHGGSSNAFTQHEATTYFFDVQHDFLPGALDRFAQFFLCPLFTESATTREMNAVDSENSKNLQSDPWRLNQLHKWAANPKHPWSRFSTGNLQTLSDKEASHVKLEVTPAASSNGTQICLNLKSQYTPGITVRDALIKFHKEHYSANLMVLAVVGRNTLDELEQLVVPLFAKVPNHDRPAPTWSEQAYPDDRLRRHFKVVPVKDFSSLTIGWPIPPIRPQYLSKPYRYISHILGHESEGSLLSLLKEKGWADQLVAGETRSNSDFATFEVTIELTEQANEHAEEIVELVFSCLKLINSKEPIQWVHDEMHALGGVLPFP